MIKVHVYEVATGQKVATIQANERLALRIVNDMFYGEKYKNVVIKIICYEHYGVVFK